MMNSSFPEQNSMQLSARPVSIFDWTPQTPILDKLALAARPFQVLGHTELLDVAHIFGFLECS